MTGEHALVALIASVALWEARCVRRDPDALLSRAVDRLRARHATVDVAAHAAVIVTALHLLRRIPSALDPYARLS